MGQDLLGSPELVRAPPPGPETSTSIQGVHFMPVGDEAIGVFKRAMNRSENEDIG
jgi:hypothetical protein